MTNLRLPAFAKFNRYLRVVGKRPDGYHDIRTIFQLISLCDYLEVEKTENSTEIRLSGGREDVPNDETNIIVRAGRLLQSQFGVKKGAKIFLEKNIPTMAGLGGGSSDAAITLLALSHLWNLRPHLKELLKLAEKLGADVPYFLYGGTAFGSGTGTKIKPLADISENYILVVKSNDSVKTENAYQSLSAPRLTNEEVKFNLTISCDGESIDNLISEARNDFEKPVFKDKSSIEDVKKTLLSNGAQWAMMSGSGASVTGIFETAEIQQSVEKICRMNDWAVYKAQTISHRKYLESLSPVRYLIESFDS